jgi:hypothetical protein
MLIRFDFFVVEKQDLQKNNRALARLRKLSPGVRLEILNPSDSTFYPESVFGRSSGKIKIKIR